MSSEPASEDDRTDPEDGSATSADDGSITSTEDGSTASSGDGDREGSTGGAGTYDRAALAADLRELVTEIEGIHPEPYHGYDGRVALHAALESAVRDLPESATLEEFYRTAAPLVANLDDAHSRVVPPDREDGGTGRLPVSLRLVGETLYVEAVYDGSLTDLLGARVLGVEGVPVDAMADRYARLRGSENRYFALKALGEKLGGNEWLDRLLGEQTAPSAPTVRFLAEGGEQRRELDPVPADRAPVAELERTVDAPEGAGPRYDLYDGGRTAVFVPGDLTCYREVIQAARERGAGYTESIAREAYGEYFEDSPPEDLDEIVPRLPSMVETLTDLVRDMDEAGTESLVVDLRDNPGGDSRFVQFLGYFLYGWDRVVEGSDWDVALKRRTEAHRERYGVPDGVRDEYATFEANPAGYDFGPRFRTRETGPERRRDALRDRLRSGAFAEELEEERHEAYYEPDRVVVATTAGTMSSAFAGAALLSELGAEVVGVPSGQAPLSFGEAVEVTLPNTGLTAEIAGSMYRWTRNPDDPVIPMARELTTDLFEDRYDGAGDASLRLALDRADGEV